MHSGHTFAAEYQSYEYLASAVGCVFFVLDVNNLINNIEKKRLVYKYKLSVYICFKYTKHFQIRKE